VRFISVGKWATLPQVAIFDTKTGMVHLLLGIGLHFGLPQKIGCLALTESQPVGPAANDRPAPTSASAYADARREAPKEADFNRA